MKQDGPLDQLQSMVVNVAVASVWTKPDSPRELDRPALQNPANVREWLASMTVDLRKELYSANRIQTQVLFGETVYIVEQRGEWAHVLIPNQPSKKDKRGYPGWIPLNQLSPAKDGAHVGRDQFEAVRVTSNHTYLYKSESEQELELSFQTCLPYIKHRDQWVTVATPAGERLLKAEDTMLLKSSSNTEPFMSIDSNELIDLTAHDDHRGINLVELGKKFLDLPYLWGGTSSFGYDCSGFVYSLHRALGVTIPRDASDQAKQGQPISDGERQPGDLLFFAYEEGKGAVHHVGMYIGDNKMIHSPQTGKTIEIIPLDGTFYEKEYCGARRYWS